jgi:hypothetical protein
MGLIAEQITKLLLVRQMLLVSLVCGGLAVAIPAAASNKSYVSANKLALKAYCSEAHNESTLLANGSTSYKDVINRASERAMVKYPNVCPDISTWRARIGAILDQYGDEPLRELCNENPDEVGWPNKPNL